jgi:hypothetical protein
LLKRGKGKQKKSHHIKICKKLASAGNRFTPNKRNYMKEAGAGELNNATIGNCIDSEAGNYLIT